jgi:hypothetical protein
MKTAQVDFSYPVLGFTPDLENWGFRDLNTLTSCGPRTLKDGSQIGMELIDANGRRWVVRSVQRTGRAGSLISWLASSLLSATPQSRIEHELEVVEPLSLMQVQDRACASLEAFPQDYCAEDERETVLASLLAKVRETKTVAEIFDVLQPDTFEAY